MKLIVKKEKWIVLNVWGNVIFMKLKNIFVIVEGKNFKYLRKNLLNKFL